MSQTVFALLLLIGLAGCQDSASTGAPRRGDGPASVRVAVTRQPQSALVFVAIAKGYFSDAGLTVQAIMHGHGKAALDSVIGTAADLAVVTETPLMFSILRGEPIAIVANIGTSNTNNAIVARKDAGITAASDLQGKRIGYTPETTSDFFLDSLLVANGLTRKAIVPVAIRPEEAQDAIVKGKVDAVSTWSYQVLGIRQLMGAGVSTFYEREIYTQLFTIAAQQEFVRQHPQTVQRFLRALLKAEDFAAASPAAAQTIVADATQIDARLVAAAWNNFSYRVVLDQSLPITLEDETRWAIKNRLSEHRAMPDYAAYIYLDGLKALRPAAVRLRR